MSSEQDAYQKGWNIGRIHLQRDLERFMDEQTPPLINDRPARTEMDELFDTKPTDSVAWLRAKYARHGEIEDKLAADELERLRIENQQAKEAIAVLDDGRPLGDIVGIHTAQNALREVERLSKELSDSNRKCEALERELSESQSRLGVAMGVLDKINEWCCYASEENIEARLMALQQIGIHARAALAQLSEKAEGGK